ncbi:MAG: hypothetical protein KGH72_02290, partial [Candidatus Micrarchaeota archaeon]|nr:hypothetical protein [Candidatus Micrarchaeota archaeon]
MLIELESDRRNAALTNSVFDQLLKVLGVEKMDPPQIILSTNDELIEKFGRESSRFHSDNGNVHLNVESELYPDDVIHEFIHYIRKKHVKEALAPEVGIHSFVYEEAIAAFCASVISCEDSSELHAKNLLSLGNIESCLGDINYPNLFSAFGSLGNVLGHIAAIGIADKTME